MLAAISLEQSGKNPLEALPVESKQFNLQSIVSSQSGQKGIALQLEHH